MSIFDNKQLMNILKRLAVEDIEILIMKDFNGNVVADVQTMAKSDLKLWVNDEGQVVALMRYNEVRVIEDFDDVLYAVEHCLHNKGHISASWAKLLQQEGILGEVW